MKFEKVLIIRLEIKFDIARFLLTGGPAEVKNRLLFK